jgi:drug/metabolite transporter (DMT)-like permease
MADTIGLVLAIVALLGWGGYAVFVKKVVDKLGEYTCLLFNHVVLVVLLGITAVFTIRLRMPTDFTTVAIIIGSIFAAIAAYLYYKSVSQGNVGVVTTLSSLYVLWTAIVSYFLFHEELNMDKYVAIGLIMVGAILAAIQHFRFPKQFDEKHITEFLQGDVFSKGAGLALIVSVFWAIYNLATKYSVIELGPHRTSVYFYALILIFILFAFLGRSTKEIITRPQGEQWKWLSISAALFSVGAVAFYFALVYLPLSTLTPIVSAAPAVTVIGAAVLLGERLRVHQYVGAVLAVAGIVMLVI